MRISVQQLTHCWMSYLGKTCSTARHRRITEKIKSNTSEENLLYWLKELGIKVPAEKEQATINRPVSSKKDFDVSKDDLETLQYILHDALTRQNIFAAGSYFILKNDFQADIIWIAKLLYGFKGALASYPYAPPTVVGDMFQDYILTQSEASVKRIATRYSLHKDIAKALLSLLYVMFYDKTKIDLVDPYIKELPTDPESAVRAVKKEKKLKRVSPRKPKKQIKRRKRKGVVYEIEEPDDFEF